MTKRMLIDATHHEETRVAVMDGSRLIEFDYESKVRRQLKSNIFLAKVTRVEPSLQAAFVNFGGNRHGFLPFAEIHPDYYRIPVADREALMAEQHALEEKAAAREAEEDETDEAGAGEGEQPDFAEDFIDAPEAMDIATDDHEEGDEPHTHTQGEAAEALIAEEAGLHDDIDLMPQAADFHPDHDDLGDDETAIDEPHDEAAEGEGPTDDEAAPSESEAGDNNGRRNNRRSWRRGRGNRRYMGARRTRDEITEEDSIAALHARFRRKYKIQEVIKRGQIMLVQVSKEERGNKGAAVTTYLSLPGRYSVLMPNSPRGGGVSRKIGNMSDRRRLKEILSSLEIPSGMSVILRTAGVGQDEAEIKRDLDYLMRLWDNIRDLTLQSTAPAQIYEEGDLIKRAIRDIYSSSIDELLIAGDAGYEEACAFMKLLMPDHVDRINLYRDEKIPLFQRYQVENQINEIGEPVVQLKSGGYLVINQTEALVAVDVNSGRATKERHIEETALKTNLEAAEEVARQLRLRDLGGLVVIDFIDMEDRRNNTKVERRLKDALSSDRARIQMSRISTFGLLELSRQRLNPSLTEAQFQKCPHCQGFGHIRTVDSATIAALRALEEEGVRGRASNIVLHVPGTIALYILNEKRSMLANIERRYGFSVAIQIDETLAPARYRVEASKAVAENDDEHDHEADEPNDEHGERPDRRGNRHAQDHDNHHGRRRNRPATMSDSFSASEAEEHPTEDDLGDENEDAPETETTDDEGGNADGARGNRNNRNRRGRRGGRGRNRDRDGNVRQNDTATGDGEQPAAETTRAPRNNPDAESAPRAPRQRRYRDADTAEAAAPTPGPLTAPAPEKTQPRYFTARRREVEEANNTPAPSSASEPAPAPTAADGPKKRGWWNGFS